MPHEIFVIYQLRGERAEKIGTSQHCDSKHVKKVVSGEVMKSSEDYISASMICILHDLQLLFAVHIVICCLHLLMITLYVGPI
jgi:hypothetical protein